MDNDSDLAISGELTGALPRNTCFKLSEQTNDRSPGDRQVPEVTKEEQPARLENSLCFSEGTLFDLVREDGGTPLN